jgi:hypothetical protein
LQTSDVVGVEVTEQHQRNLVDAQLLEAAVDVAELGAGIDHDPFARPTGGQNEAVPLADIARNHEPSRWRPTGAPHPHRYDNHDGREHQRDHDHPPPPVTHQ